MNRFEQWRVLVTGAGSGIGAAAALLFVEEGATVIGVDPDGEGLRRTESKLLSVSGNFLAIEGDITNPEDRASCLARLDGSGRLDVLVNNAAVFLLAAETATHHEWSRTLEVNLVAPAELVAEALPHLRLSTNPAVVNVASISAHVGQTGRWTYNSSKAGILELTRCQALDLAHYGIRVNSISPGWIWTELLQRAASGDSERWQAQWGAYSPLRRCGQPVEVARAILFLASLEASFITGSDLVVDGGYLAYGPEAGGEIRIQ